MRPTAALSQNWRSRLVSERYTHHLSLWARVPSACFTSGRQAVRKGTHARYDDLETL